VLIGFDEWESLQETIFWLSQPGIHESIADARREIAEGRTHDEAQMRAELGVPKRAH
jgi:PHD/YefM family antitoxin component YafN of YafNO toxin-antitoxin module